MTPAKRSLISFLDLALLMTGVMAMLASVGGQHPAAATAIAARFGDGAIDRRQLLLPIETLFEPSEARLSAAGRARLAKVAAEAGRGELAIAVPVGHAPPDGRLDRWELAAARTASIMRALMAAGLDERQMTPELQRPIDADRADQADRSGVPQAPVMVRLTMLGGR